MATVTERKKRAGRPAKAVKKEVRAAIRFTRAEYFIVKEKAAKAGMKASAYLRQLAIHSSVKPRLTDEERQYVRELIGFSNNVNQLAKKCHQEGFFKAALYFEGMGQDLDKILKKFKP